MSTFLQLTGIVAWVLVGVGVILWAMGYIEVQNIKGDDNGHE